jgi:hypothetical protein
MWHIVSASTPFFFGKLNIFVELVLCHCKFALTQVSPEGVSKWAAPKSSSLRQEPISMMAGNIEERFAIVRYSFGTFLVPIDNTNRTKTSSTFGKYHDWKRGRSRSLFQSW